MEMSRRSASEPPTWLNSDGWRTPRRAARAAWVSWSSPTSSASSAASVTTRSVFSPALGTSGVRQEEGEHDRNHLAGELAVRVMRGALDHLVPPPAARYSVMPSSPLATPASYKLIMIAI